MFLGPCLLALSKCSPQFLEIEGFDSIPVVFSILNGNFLATKEEEICSSHKYFLTYVLNLSLQVDVTCTSQTSKGKHFKFKCS